MFAVDEGHKESPDMAQWMMSLLHGVPIPISGLKRCASFYYFLLLSAAI